jgi:hypothetical protein
MSSSEHQHNGTICPWCHSEIVWDEEIGPEPFCPHCSNELSGYRTLQIGIDQHSDNSDEDELEHDHDHEENEWSDDSDEWTESAKAGDGFRQARRSSFAVEEKIERVLDDQLEVPECPSCRGYMLELGAHQVTRDSFKQAVPSAVGQSLLAAPFETVLYVCPSCFETSTKLSFAARQQLTELLEKSSK